MSLVFCLENTYQWTKDFLTCDLHIRLYINKNVWCDDAAFNWTLNNSFGPLCFRCSDLLAQRFDLIVVHRWTDEHTFLRGISCYNAGGCLSKPFHEFVIDRGLHDNTVDCHTDLS